MDPPLTPQPPLHHLPRLSHEHYRGTAAILWTITFEHRAVGWLDPLFHTIFRELLLHTAARESLHCPVYVLMPDHIHLCWLGLKLTSDQRNAMRFLRTLLQAELNRRSSDARKYTLQKQSHDTVLQEKDRTHGAFARTCFYILDNPQRKNLVNHPRDWPFLGAVVPGYPSLHPLNENFWPLFWKLYANHRKQLLSDRSGDS